MVDQTVSVWKIPPKFLSLESDIVHVWRIQLDLNKHDLTKFLGVLSEDEVDRAKKLYVEADRIRYIVVRAALRIILGNYEGVAPSDLDIAYSQQGKPYLSSKSKMKDIKFNLSHTGDLGLIAVAVGRQVGVDIELVRQESSIKTIAKRFFSPEENRKLTALPDSLQPEAFFTCWTRKEAFVKATGKGLLIPLNQFQVSFYPDDTPQLLNVGNDPDEPERWSMFHLDPGLDYVGALIVEGKDLNVMGWDWSEASN